MGFPSLHPAQSHVNDNRKRFTVLCCGRRWGKSEYIQHWLCDGDNGAVAGWPVAYIAPIYPMVTEVYKALTERLAPLISRKVDGRRIELTTGGVIDLWSMENGGDRMRGRKYKRVAPDECALVTDLVSVWEKVIRPTLTDYQGEALFASTPRRGSGFQALYNRADTDPEWAAFRMPTSTNPFIAPEEIEAARRGMSEQYFAQEFLADFEASESDLVYPEFDYRVHVAKAPCSWRACKWRIVGIDPGGGDPTAIVPLGVAPDTRVHQYGEFNRVAVSLEEVTAFLTQLGEVDFILVGETGGEIITNTLMGMGFPAYKADMKRGEGMEHVRWLLQSGVASGCSHNHDRCQCVPRLTVDPNCGTTIRQYSEYRWAKKRDPETGEKYATRAAADHHADLMDAQRYAVMGLIRGMPGESGPVRTVWE